MVLAPFPFPFDTPIAMPRRRKLFKADEVDPLEGKMPLGWQNALSSMNESITLSAQRVGSVIELTSQSASISATALSGVDAAGLYLITYVAKISVAASVSSTLTVTFTFTYEGDTCTRSGTAITGNTVTTFQTDIFPINIDGNSVVNYSTTYGSVGTAMEYSLVIGLQKYAA